MSHQKIIINADGGARGNPGPAAAGAVIYLSNSAKYAIKQYLGKATNNEAEYQAVILALKGIKQLLGKKWKAKQVELKIRVDSELVYKQLTGEYKVKEERLQKFFIEIWNLKQDFGRVSFNLVPRTENKEADKLVNEALDENK